jgi:UDP-3-O-[3-hydroxymyristoyl] glucosamine N-acyltransferase
LTLQEIADRIQGRVRGDPSVPIKGVSPLETAKKGELSFLANPKYKMKAETTKASALIISKETQIEGKNFIVVENPLLALAHVLEIFHAEKYVPTGVSPDARIGRDCDLGKDLSLFPFVTIGERCKIGNRVRLHPSVSIADDCIIGDDAIIYANVSLYRRSRIGSRVLIHSGTAVGSDGYGFASEKGKHHKIPQVGGVIIEDDVEIGSNCSIDRGAMNDTVIHRGTKIDNLVQIAHNVIIGEDSLIVAQVGISGSTKMGKGVIFAGQSGAAGHLTIGDHAVIAAKSAVFQDIPPKTFVAGNPAVHHMQWKKAQVTFRQLPEIREEIIKLKEKLERLEKRLNKEKDSC